jgi:hypothetical protein
MRLDHNQLGIVPRAMRPCHRFCCAGASRQRGNLNLNKRVIREISVYDEWLMSRQETHDTRLAHSRYLGNAR